MPINGQVERDPILVHNFELDAIECEQHFVAILDDARVCLCWASKQWIDAVSRHRVAYSPETGPVGDEVNIVTDTVFAILKGEKRAATERGVGVPKKLWI